MRLGAALVAALVVAACPLAASAAPRQWSASFRDLVGDAAGAPDILGMSVGSSDGGRVSLAVHADLAAAGSVVSIFLNTDGSRATGARKVAGADYAFVATDGGGTVGLLRWRNGDWEAARAGSGRSKAYSGTLAIWVSRRDLGDPSSLDVVALSVLGPSADRMPDTGAVHYDLRPLHLSTRAFAATTRSHGEVLSFVPLRSDSGTVLTGVRPSCTLRVGSSVVAAKTIAPARIDAPARCTWRLPDALRGRKATASMRVAYAGRTASRTASFTIH
jgi:hypothetical protein